MYSPSGISFSRSNVIWYYDEHDGCKGGAQLSWSTAHKPTSTIHRTTHNEATPTQAKLCSPKQPTSPHLKAHGARRGGVVLEFQPPIDRADASKRVDANSDGSHALITSLS